MHSPPAMLANKCWIYEGNPIAFDYPHIKLHGWYGFVYEISNWRTGRSYIGKKCFHFFRKGSKRESDWRTYWSSSVPLKQDLITCGNYDFQRVILGMAKDAKRLAYLEISTQYLNNVLLERLPSGSYKYYNEAIASDHFFRKDLS